MAKQTAIVDIDDVTSCTADISLDDSADDEATSSPSLPRQEGNNPPPKRGTVSSPPPLTILMIGSTGNGKSTLGNFLLDPREEHISGNNQIFRTARTNMPETTIVHCASEKKKRPSLQVIDTPGLNENAFKDLLHMIHIVRKLKELQSVHACILCVKFDLKIDAQYKATVAYYRKLLPSLFERNVVIVMTSFLTDSRSDLMRQKQGLDVDAIVNNARREVIESGQLTFQPQVFMIDSLPLTEDERKTSEKCRASILDFIRQSLRPISIKDMRVAKTAALRQQDENEISRLDGEIHGYNNRLIEANKAAKVALKGIEKREKTIVDTKGEIQRIKSQLKDKDTDTRVTAQSWSVKNSWKWFKSQTESFEVSSAWPIVDCTKWDNGQLKWKDFEWTEDPGRAHGKVTGKWFRGLYANLTLLTEKRIRHREEISALKQTLKMQEENLKKLHSDVKEFKEMHSMYQADIDLLHQYIKNRSARKEKLLVDPIPIEEADTRLADLMKLVSST